MHALLFSALLLAAPDRPDLHGTVRDAAGKPVAGATVFIHTAAVRVGTSPYCPSCYPDCRKQVVTDGDGRFVIPSLDPELLFRVLVAGDGYEPTFAMNVDPASGPIEVSISGRDLSELDPKQVIRGRVVDHEDKPVVGATLTPIMGATRAVDPIAVTNLDGRFSIGAKRSIDYVTFRVEAPRLAPRATARLAPKRGEYLVRLDPGGFLAGHVVRDGRPVPGVGLGLVQVDRSPRSFVGSFEIGTDESGTFLFSNVPPGEYFVYGGMETFAGGGSVPARRVRVGSRGVTELGELEVIPGSRLRGRVVLSDGKSIPPGTRLVISRDDWDSQTLELDPAGQFDADGFPPGLYSVSVKVPGYRLSDRNKSADPLVPTSLRGRIERDVDDMTILLEPGSLTGSLLSVFNAAAVERRTVIESVPLEGVSASRGSP